MRKVRKEMIYSRRLPLNDKFILYSDYFATFAVYEFHLLILAGNLDISTEILSRL